MFGSSFQAGTIVRFTYDSKETRNRFKRVLVLNPLWQGKIHGLDLSRMTPAECEVIRAIFDPKTKDQPHRFPLVNDIVTRMDPIDEARTNPFAFYRRFCRPFLKTAGDVYRTYYPKLVSNIVLETDTTAPPPVTNPLGSKPLGGSAKPLGESGSSKPLGSKPLGEGNLFKKG